MTKKIALLIGVSEYGESIPPLSSPLNDVEAIERVLRNPTLGGFEQVEKLLNPDVINMRKGIEKLFKGASREDLVLLYFSGHGIIDDDDYLYLTTKDTVKEYFKATSVDANFIQKQSGNSYAKRQILILDACYSGAFAQGWQPKTVSMEDIKKNLGAEGRVVLTSSSATQKSFEQPDSILSLYTNYLVEGIETGAADTNNDGKIYAHELHDYAKTKVQILKPNVKPEIILDKEGYNILLAYAPKNTELQYCELVEKYAKHGEISQIAMEILKKKAEELKITNEKAAEIEGKVLEPYRRLIANLEIYKVTFTREVERQYPLHQNTINTLKDYRYTVLGLEDEDVANIELEIISSKELEYQKKILIQRQIEKEQYEKNLQYYQKEFTEAVELQYPIDKNIYNELKKLQQSLGLKDEDIKQVEKRILSQNIRQRGVYSPIRLILIRSRLFLVSLVFVSISCVIFIIYRFSSSENTNQISRGEKTLFPMIHNQYRDQGIEAYKQGKYKDATDFFKNAVDSDPNNAEVLIYYNNAKAVMSEKKPITLAVVVPIFKHVSIDENKNILKGKAQEMLRGVAQAQNQFNKNRGLNDRLLEIVIANDANDASEDTETSQQVARNLITDDTILGIIGHYSSESTQAALNTYQEAKLAIISPTSTSAKLTSPVLFRTIPPNTVAGNKLADYATSLGIKKVVVFSNAGISSETFQDAFSKEFKKDGGEIINNGKPIELNDNPQFDNDNAVQASIYKYQAQAAALFPDVNHLSQALNIAEQNSNIISSSQQKRGLKLLGGSTFYLDSILKKDGKPNKSVEGFILAIPWFRKSPQSQKFAQAAYIQWGGEVSWPTATSFDATQAFIEVFKKSSNLSRATVLETLPHVNLTSNNDTLQDVLTTSGDSLKFDIDHNREMAPVIVQVKNGEFELP